MIRENNSRKRRYVFPAPSGGTMQNLSLDLKTGGTRKEFLPVFSVMATSDNNGAFAAVPTWWKGTVIFSTPNHFEPYVINGRVMGFVRPDSGEIK